MNSVPEIPDIPKRISLSSQAAMHIRKRIEEGMWCERLPSERKLCEILRVSRPTVRMALHQLGQEGVLYQQRGRRNRLLSKASSVRTNNHRVGLITHEPFSSLMTTSIRWVGSMREELLEQRVRMETFVCEHSNPVTERRRIERFLLENNISCCVLMSVSKEIQRWFVEHDVPALVAGSCHASISLPSIDVDYRSVCRHAAGVFLRHKHQHIVFVTPNTGIAGDLAGEQGFREAMAGYAGTQGSIVRHNGSVQSITMQMDELFASARPPTALFVSMPTYMFTVIMYLFKRGLSVPERVSLIARDADVRFDAADPMISHYRFEPSIYAHKLARLILKLICNESLPKEPLRIFPKYIEGGSVTFFKK